jgi:drug/metabolite transporter (DMT)-like permease
MLPDSRTAADTSAAAARTGWAGRHDALTARASRLSAPTRALLWATASGLLFCVLNALARVLTTQLEPMQAQFLRYFFGMLVLLPWVLRHGLAAFRPKRIGGQFLRGAVHTVGLILWFIALPKIPLADMTAIGFTGPIFIMIGAYLFLKEPMRWERWLATVLGFIGVLIVVAPKLSGSGGTYHLVMFASAPIFAASFLLTKALTRTESAGVIVLWQAITVTLFSLPLALPVWQSVSAWQWLGFAISGMLGTGGHYCLTRAYVAADISATQSLRFLDLIWSALLGFLIFADVPTTTTLAGGALICAATLWVAHRESRALPAPEESP